MRKSLRLACVSLILASACVSSPATALAAQKPPAGKKAPDPAKAPAKKEAKETMDDDTAIAILAILGGVVVLGVGGFVAWRLLSGRKGDGRPPELILPLRQHDWEMRLSPEQEAAMLRGIQAYRDGGHSLYLSHGDALITFYDPTMLVSLHRLTDLFLNAGPAGLSDPNGIVRSILEGFVAQEAPGVLHLRKGWFVGPIDALDHLKFTNLCYDTLTCPQPYIEGTQGSSADENNGCLTLKVEVGGPMNALCVDLRRVLPLVQQARFTRASEPLIELVRPVLQGMARGEIPGGMWTRGGATPAEIDLVTRVVATSAQRAS